MTIGKKVMSRLQVAMLLALVAACSSTPAQVNYYLLANYLPELQGNFVSNAAEPFTLSRLTLADYLDQPALAMLQGDHRVVYASQHVWAEQLARGFARVLAYDVNQLNGRPLLLASHPDGAAAGLKLELTIDQFLPTDKGNVVLQGRYWLINDGKVLNSAAFQFDERLQGDGYAEAVSAQRLLISRLAKLLEAAVEAL